MKNFKRLLLAGAIFAGVGSPAFAQELTLSFNRTGTDASSVTVSASGIDGVTATLNSVSHALKGSAGAVTSAILCPNVNANTSPTITFDLTVSGLPGNYSFTNIGYDIHALNGANNYQEHGDNQVRQWNVSTKVNDQDFYTLSDIDIAAGVNPGGDRHKVWEAVVESAVKVSSTMNLTITVTKGTTNGGCFFGLSSITFSNPNGQVEPDPVVPVDPSTLVEFVNPVGTDLEWTVGTCCYEKVGEGNGVNGAVSQITDGDKSNYWHSAYESASTPHTGHHYFTFDLKEEREIGGFNWTARTSAPAPDALEHGLLRGWEIYVADNADEFAFASNAAMEAYCESHEAAATGTCDVQYASNEFSVTFTSLVKGQYFLLVATEVGQKGSWISNDYEFLHCVEFSFLATEKVVEPVEPEVEPILVYNIFEDDLKWTISEFCCEEPKMELPSGPIEKLIDNDPSTFYHSLWSSGEPHGTHYFVVDLKQQTDLYGFAWLPRQNPGSNNGTWMTYNVFVSDDASAFDFTGQINEADYSTQVDRHTALENLVNAYVQDHADEAITGTLTAVGNDAAESAMFDEKVTGRYVFFAITESNRDLSCAAELGFYVPSTPELEDKLIGTLRETKLAQVTCYEGNVPGASEIVGSAVDQIKALGAKDFEANADAIIAEVRGNLQKNLSKLATEGKTFVIKNKRLASMGKDSYLACVADSINSVAEPGDNIDAYWTVRSVGAAVILRNAGRQEYAVIEEGATYFSLSANSDDALGAAFNFTLKDNGYVAMTMLYIPGNTDSWTRSYNIDSRGNGLTYWYTNDDGEDWSLEYAELPEQPEQPDPRLEEIKARFAEVISVYETYQESVPFYDLSDDIKTLELFGANAKDYLEWSENEFNEFMDGVQGSTEEMIMGVLVENAGKLWTLYQPGQKGYLCATTKSTNQGWDSFNYQSEADENAQWTLVAGETQGQFYLRSAKGQYIGTPKQHYCRVDNTKDDAGLFTFGLKDGYVTFNSVAFPGCALGLDGKNDPAEIMTLEDGSNGYRWQVTVAEKPVKPEPVAVDMTVTPAGGKVDALS
ncbi:MAG: discoidin domain-containing protein, partial [Muribaculaceae bacterium]|nr:discoidin domain-containing protein [Muribaculaceae bacterium]